MLSSQPWRACVISYSKPPNQRVEANPPANCWVVSAHLSVSSMLREHDHLFNHNGRKHISTTTGTVLLADGRAGSSVTNSPIRHVHYGHKVTREKDEFFNMASFEQYNGVFDWFERTFFALNTAKPEIYMVQNVSSWWEGRKCDRTRLKNRKYDGWSRKLSKSTMKTKIYGKHKIEMAGHANVLVENPKSSNETLQNLR